MFNHLLIPADGSSLSEAALAGGVRFAGQIGARLSLIHVGTPFHPLAWEVEALTDTREEYERYQRRKAQAILAAGEALAQRAGVPFAGIFVTHEHPYEAILQVARERGCDLILMASHGRKGLQGLLLGSETQKVLAHSRVPVLVYR